MELIISLIFAIVPGIGLAVFIYTIDDHEPEPVNLLVLSFILGMASFAFSLIPGKFLDHLVDGIHNLLRARAVHAFASVAFIEEVSKFAIVRGILYRNHNFNEPLDGIVYSVMVGLGFATLENVVYVYYEGIDSGFLRMFTAIPAHAMFAVVMGYFLGIAKFKQKNEFSNAVFALLLAVILHGAYDYFLFISYIPGMWLGALACFIVTFFLASRSIKIHREYSPLHKHDGENPDLEIGL